MLYIHTCSYGCYCNCSHADAAVSSPSNLTTVFFYLAFYGIFFINVIISSRKNNLCWKKNWELIKCSGPLNDHFQWHLPNIQTVQLYQMSANSLRTAITEDSGERRQQGSEQSYPGMDLGLYLYQTYFLLMSWRSKENRWYKTKANSVTVNQRLMCPHDI